MNVFVRRALLSGLSAAALTSSAGATTISGNLDDTGNSALISSNGFGDVGAAQFGSDDAVSRNVAIYALDVTAAGTVQFASNGYAAGGAQPYLTLFAGNDTSATFVDSSYFDPNIDFDLFETVSAGHFLVAIGVYENESFAENDPATGTLADGFTALGVPAYLGSAFYRLDVESTDATFTIGPATNVGGTVPQPAPTNVPEPGEIALVVIGSMSMVATLRRCSRDSSMSRRHWPLNLFQETS